MQSSSYNDAINAYTEAIKIDSSNHVYFSNRSAAYFSVGRFDDSVADAAECVRIAPTWSKGYNRLSTALVKVHKLEEAILVCKKGLEIDSNNSNLVQTYARIKQLQAFELLRGKWNGSVSEAIGGYLQEFDFINEEDVILTVLGNQVNAKFILDATSSPGHLDMNVPSQPHLPVVRHIYKFENFDKATNLPMELHLCSPYLTDPNSRPTSFEGPAYVVMHRGNAVLSEHDIKEARAIAKLSDEEKMTGFLNEAIGFTPNRFSIPLEGDSDQVLSEKMTASVKFQSNYQKIRTKYGEMIEAIVKQMVIGDIKPPNADIQNLVSKFREKMKNAGLFGSPEEANEIASAAAAASSQSEPFIEDKLKYEPSTKSIAPKSSEGSSSKLSKPSKPAKTSSEISSSNTSNYYLSLVVVGVCIGIAIASAAILSKRNSER